MWKRKKCENCAYGVIEKNKNWVRCYNKSFIKENPVSDAEFVMVKSNFKCGFYKGVKSD